MNGSAEEFMREYEQAANAHDLERSLSLIDDDAIFLFSDESVHVGKAAIRRAFRKNFDTIESETYSVSNLTWLAATEDVAACVYDFAWSGTIGGQPASGSGRGTSVLRSTRGEWKIIHEHLSRGRFAI